MTTTEIEELARELRGIHMGWDGDTPAGHIFSDDLSAVIAARTAIEFLTALGYRRISPTEVVVPKEPTEAMLDAGYEVLCRTDEPPWPYHWEGWITPQVYREMIAASPPKDETQ